MLKSLFRSPQCPSSDDPYGTLAENYGKRIRKARGWGSLVAPTGDRVGIVVSPWQKTAVPFYLMEWALRLRREGLAVEFVWDVWPNESGKSTDEEVAILRTLETARKAYGIPIVVPDGDADSAIGSSSRIERLAFEAVTRKRKREPQLDDPEVAGEKQRLIARVARVQGFIAARKYAWLMVPGGVWEVSGVYWEISQSLGLGLTTFDSGVGLLCFQHGGPAAHFPDLNSAMQSLTASCMRDETVRSRVKTWVDDRLAVRRKGEDEFRLQPTRSDGVVRHADIVVPLNYRLDTAAMCRQRLFPSVNDWLRAVVDWAAARPEVSVVFRQHPCEKIPEYRSQEDYSWIAASGPNLSFIAAEDPVNTYDLLAGCRVVLPHSSRVGIEAGIWGKSVIMAASSYYEKMAFARIPATRDAYFEEIEQGLQRTADPTLEERCSAYAAYYVAESFGLHKTHFTPMPTDFEIWGNWSPQELWEKDQNEIFLQAAITRHPAAEILVEKRVAEWADLKN